MSSTQAAPQSTAGIMDNADSQELDGKDTVANSFACTAPPQMVHRVGERIHPVGWSPEDAPLCLAYSPRDAAPISSCWVDRRLALWLDRSARYATVRERLEQGVDGLRRVRSPLVGEGIGMPAVPDQVLIRKEEPV